MRVRMLGSIMVAGTVLATSMIFASAQHESGSESITAQVKIHTAEFFAADADLDDSTIDDLRTVPGLTINTLQSVAMDAWVETWAFES